MDRWGESIDEITHQFMEKFGSVPPETLHERPSPDRWSVAETLDHLIRFNESYDPQIDALLAGQQTPPIISRIPGLPHVMKRMLHHFIKPDNPRRMKTMNLWKPRSEPPDKEILSRFEAHQQRLKTKMEASRPLLEQHAMVHSPASRWIVYELEGAFEMILDHERRHLKQAIEALDQVTTPSET